MRVNNKKLVVLCEHASHNIPTEFDNLGLPSDIVASEVGYDVGAVETAEYIAQHFNCELFSGETSRLLIDLNRCPDDASMIPKSRHGINIPANADISDEEKNKRREFYDVYHNKVTTYINELVAQGKEPVVVSIHSFSQEYMSSVLKEDVKTECGLLFDEDERLADVVYSSVKQTDINLENNYPYSLKEYKSGGVILHGERNGYPYLGVEFPNTMLVQKPQREKLADALIKGLEIFLGS